MDRKEFDKIKEAATYFFLRDSLLAL